MKAPETHLITRGLIFPGPTTGALDLTERRDAMRRFTHPTRSLVVFATMLATALVSAALPLAALASNGGPGA